MKWLKLVIFLSLPILFLSSWYVLNGDLIFHTDMGRDFLLLDELYHKKLVLIGPRADWTGLFHGPLWLYFNLPAYLIGHGNPIVVGWYWIFLLIIFAAIYYFIVKKMFDKNTSILYIPLFLSSMIAYTNNFYNPIGALFLSPLLYYLTFQYSKTKKLIFMLLDLLIVGLIFQFQIAVGGPLLILLTVFFIFQIIKEKKYFHLLGLFTIFIPLSTFILFDIRHNFMQFNGLINHLTGKEKFYSIDFLGKLLNRIDTMTVSGLGFFNGQYWVFNIIAGYILVLTIYYVFSNKKSEFWTQYGLFLYLYLGFYFLSMIHNGLVLMHYFLPLIPLPILIFVSSYKYLNRKFFFASYFFIIIFNLFIGIKMVQSSNQYIGKDRTSWKFLLSVAKTVYENSNENNIGVYLFAPDMYGYSQKYAMLYGQSLFPEKKMSFSKKRKETFLVYETTPVNRPDLNGSGWKTLLVKIDTPPIKTFKFSNGYRIEKYVLNEEQLKIPSDSLLNDWVSQR
ncbi:MAG: hypothetical protein V1803_01925 [Candidatus Roizmanbacteria bacterium]